MMDIFYFDKELKKGKLNDLEKIKKHLVWIDITNIGKHEADLIKNAFKLHPLTKEDLITDHVRIKVEEFPNYLFCVFYCIEKNKTIGLVEMDFVIGKKYIISNHVKEIPSFTELKHNKEKLEILFSKGPDFILHKLLDNEIDNYFPVLETIDDQITEIEDHVTKRPQAEYMKQILKLKRLLMYIKKISFPQREKISFLAKNEYRFISEKAVPYFRDIYDHMIRVSDMIDNYREAVQNTFEEYMSAVNNNLNEVMKVLSVIATIALPLTVISSIYGTNFNVLPGAGYPYGFWLMIILMIVMSLSMVHYFRKRKWF